MRVFCVDWLTLYCCSDAISDSMYFSVRKTGRTSRQFKCIYEVVDRDQNKVVAICECRPFSPIIPFNTVMLKVDNRILYYDGWQGYVLDMCRQICVTPLSVSRIDMACDLQQFDNGLTPKSLINGFLTNKYLKNGRSSYQLQGEQKHEHEVSYLRFGKHDSDVSVYLYNKTKEMYEVKFKHHIFEMWKQAGFDINRDVWRLEVSLRPGNVRFGNSETGEYCKMSVPDLNTYGILMDYYECLVDQYFHFKKNDGKANKSRMKQVEIIKRFRSTWFRLKNAVPIDSTRSSRIFINHLIKSPEVMQINRKDFPTQFFQVLDMYAERMGLQGYRTTKENIYNYQLHKTN